MDGYTSFRGSVRTRKPSKVPSSYKYPYSDNSLKPYDSDQKSTLYKPLSNSNYVLLENLSNFKYFYNKENKTFGSIFVPELTPDYIQYLINNDCFHLSNNLNNTYSYLSLNTPNQNILCGSSIPGFINVSKGYRDLATVIYKDLFNCVRYYINYDSSSGISLPDQNTSESNSQYFNRIYEKSLEQLRKIFRKQLDAMTLPNEATANIFKYNVEILHPCSTYYGKKKSYHKVDFVNEPDDLMKLNYTARYVTLDHLRKYIADSESQKSRPKPYELKYFNTSYRDENGDIRDTVIMREMTFRGKRCFIIGSNGISFMPNVSIKDTPEYKAILKLQSDEYENDIKELLVKYHYQDGIDPKTVDITDLTYNLIVYPEMQYIKEYNLLNNDELKKLNTTIRGKLKTLFNNKFNKPNISLEYTWSIIIEEELDKFYPLIYTLREVNADHKPIFEMILELTRTEMLTKWGLEPSQQIFSYYQVQKSFLIKSKYLHPLHYLGRTNTFYNRLITLEELIYSCDKKCDGIDDYLGLPFWAVCPMKYSIMNPELMSYEKQDHYNKFAEPVFKYLGIEDTTKNEKKNNNNGFVQQKHTKHRQHRQYSQSTTRASTLKNIVKNSNVPNFYDVLSIDGNEDDNKRSRNNTQKSMRNTNIKTKKNVNNTKSENIINKTQYIYYIKDEEGKDKEVRKYASDDETKLLLARIFTPKHKNNRVIVSYNTYDHFISCLIRCLDGDTYKFYNIFMEKGLFDSNRDFSNSRKDVFNFSKVNKLIEYNDIYYREYLYGYTGKLLRILLIKEYNRKDNFMLPSIHMNIYRIYKNLDNFFRNDVIQLTDGTTITNPYKYHLIHIIYFTYWLYSLGDTIVKKLTEQQNLEIYTKEKSKTNTKNNTVYIPIKYFNFEIKKNNNIYFVYKAKKYIGILDRFSGDYIKSEFKKDKYMNEEFFKFTLWIVPIETIEDIYTKYKDKTNTTAKDFIRNKLSSNLFTASSIKGKELTNDLEDIITNVKQFINEYYDITEFDYNILNINELSDMITTSFHIHIELKSQYFKPLEEIDYKKELLSSKLKLYRYPGNIQGHFSFETILNKLKTNSNYLYNQSLYRPFNGLIKFPGLMCS